MFIIHTNKKLYSLILCTLLLVQPLKPITFNKTYNDIIFCVLFFGGCALCGMITSFLKKSATTKPNIEKKEPIIETSDTLRNRIAYLDNATERLNIRLTRQETNFPTAFKKIKKLEKQCNALAQQNTQLLTTLESIKKGVNGYVPAFVAAYWFHTSSEQTKTSNNSNQSLSGKKYLTLTEHKDNIPI